MSILQQEDQMEIVMHPSFSFSILSSYDPQVREARGGRGNCEGNASPPFVLGIDKVCHTNAPSNYHTR